LPDSYSVVFCSRNPNVVSNADLNNVVYTVNWDAILPKKYKKFDCQFIFKSENTATVLTNTGFIGMNFGSAINIYDGQQSTTQQLGIIYPAVVGAQYFYSSTNNDNNNFRVSYPNQQLITLTLRNFDRVTNLANAPHYTLMLNLVGVLDEDLYVNEPDSIKLRLNH
jgi:hypothetical protein